MQVIVFVLGAIALYASFVGLIYATNPRNETSRQERLLYAASLAAFAVGIIVIVALVSHALGHRW